MIRSALRVCVVIAATASALGQTSDDLAAKYPAVSAYEVRPRILMTARYTRDGQVCELSLERRHTTPKDKEIDLGSNIPAKLVDELTEELVPASERGPETSRYLSPDSFVFGGISYTKKDFENISIEIHGSTSESCNGGEEVVIIRWRKRTCGATETKAIK
jgi:hypothetical protein